MDVAYYIDPTLFTADLNGVMDVISVFRIFFHISRRSNVASVKSPHFGTTKERLLGEEIMQYSRTRVLSRILGLKLQSTFFMRLKTNLSIRHLISCEWFQSLLRRQLRYVILPTCCSLYYLHKNVQCCLFHSITVTHPNDFIYLYLINCRLLHHGLVHVKQLYTDFLSMLVDETIQPLRALLRTGNS